MVQPPFPFSTHLLPPLTPSASTPPLLPLLCSNSKVYLHNLYNYVMPTLRLTVDQYQTHLDLVPMPRAAIYTLSQLAMGCVTCHACHGCVTDFRPILGNPVEVTHVTSLGHVYIFPH